MVAFHPAFLFKEGFEALIQVFRCLCLPDCQMDMSEMRITKKCIEGMLSVDPFVYGGTATASVRDKLRLGSGVRFRIFAGCLVKQELHCFYSHTFPVMAYGGERRIKLLPCFCIIIAGYQYIIRNQVTHICYGIIYACSHDIVCTDKGIGKTMVLCCPLMHQHRSRFSGPVAK